MIREKLRGESVTFLHLGNIHIMDTFDVCMRAILLLKALRTHQELCKLQSQLFSRKHCAEGRQKENIVTHMLRNASGADVNRQHQV